MRGFAAVFGREVAEWWKALVIASLALGVVAALLPMGMARAGLSVSDVRSGASLLLALLMSAALALILGGSVISSDLSEKRLGFYFSRPLQGWALWTGKMAAGAALAAGGGLLVLIPSLLLGDGPGLFGDLEAAAPVKTGLLLGAVVWGACLLHVLLAAHAFSVILRARSPWIGLDVAALGVIVALFGVARERLVLAGLTATSRLLITDLVLFLLIGPVLFAAGAVQVLQGRTDLRRAHRLLSGTLWGLLLVLMLLFEGTSRWFVHASPTDLRQVFHVTAPREGSWISLTGLARHRPGYLPSFLYDVSSGRFRRARFGVSYHWGPVPQVGFSADGRRALWMEFQDRPLLSPLAVWYQDLDRPDAEPVRSNILFEGPVPQGLAVSPDGSRFATLHKGRLLVTGIETGRLLASVPVLSESPFSRLAFVDSDRVRMYASNGVQEMNSHLTELRIYELNVTTATLEETGHVPGVPGFRGWSLSPAGDRAILRSRKELRLHDARTGELLAGLEGGDRRFVSFLKDGRLAAAGPVPGGMELRILAPDGRTQLRRFLFPGVQRLALADQPAEGRLRIVTADRLEKPRDWQLRLLDLQTGEARPATRLSLTLIDHREDESVSDLTETGGVLWYDWQAGQDRAVLRSL